ncbi:MAG: hypothetical protein ACRC1H_11065 [Caldilineaceae bacterium]
MMENALLCTAPPAWTRVRGVAHKSYIWAKQPYVKHWCDIDVRFMGGDDWQRETVRAIVTGPHGWNAVCGAQFVFGDLYTAPVRVSFEPGASWSHPGNYGVNGPFELPTLNLGWIRPDFSERELFRVTTHEFGHALAMMHEHQHPGAGIPWNRPAIYAIYRRSNGWPPDVVESQVLQVIDAEVAVATAYDPLSIMGYPIDEAMVLDPAWAHERAFALSAGDIAAAQALYGPSPWREEPGPVEPPGTETKQAYLPTVRG